MKAKIIGYGISGKSAESFLESRQIETIVVKDAQETVKKDYDFCVVSPGVPSATLGAETVPIIPEVELPFYLDPKLKPRCLVAVTGTNGKTTIVNQITQMCLLSGRGAVLCGNVGIPVSRVADKLSKAIAVVEVSSFMLEQTKILHPNIAVITNVTSDHLDRHGSMEEYLRCKKQIATRQTRHDILIVNWDNLNARNIGLEIQKRRGPRVIWYSTQETVKGYYVANGVIYERLGRWRRQLERVNGLDKMPHTLSNALAVVAVGRRLRLPLSAIFNACHHREQSHRIQLVADVNGVAFYNDSKATNIAATLAATRSFKLPICLILCGLTKGQDYAELFADLPDSVQHIIVFGACQEAVVGAAQATNYTAVHPVKTLRAALLKAVAVCPQPGVILFSPSGSSFDQFKNYVERGERFCELVREVILPKPQCSPPADENL